MDSKTHADVGVSALVATAHASTVNGLLTFFSNLGLPMGRSATSGKTS